MKKELIPGIVLLFSLAFFSRYCSELVTIGGKHPLEASVIAIVIGMILRNSELIPTSFTPGILLSEKFLIYGIVLMGATLHFGEIASQGGAILGIILLTMTFGYLITFFIGRLFRLPDTLSILLAIGTTICGTTAIAVTAPLIKAKEEVTSYAVATISLWGLIAILLYPQIAQLFAVSDVSFGVFAGTAIHSTPQVVGAGFMYSAIAGKTATAVKLIRNCFMAPLAFLIGLFWVKATPEDAKTKISLAKIFPWFLFGYFAMAGLNTAGYLSPTLSERLAEGGKLLILVGMVGIGLTTSFTNVKTVGLLPLVVGFLGAVAVAASSIALIAVLL